MLPRQPVNDPRAQCTGSHDDWLACITAMACAPVGHTPQASAVTACAVSWRRRVGDF